MIGNGSITRGSGRQSGKSCWAMLSTLSVGAFLFTLLASPISADDTGYGEPSDPSPPVGVGVGQIVAVGQVYSEEGENLTTPATPIRQFVWKVRNWMFHRDDEDVNIEVDATSDATSESPETERSEESKSWVRSVAAWFARGIRHLLEQLTPPENGDGSGSGSNGTEEALPQDGTKPKDGSEDSVTKPTKHVFRPWTALPPPPPPGMTASPEAVGSSTGSTPVYTKPPSTVAGKTTSDSSGGKFSTSGGKATIDPATGTSKKPKRRRPKPVSTSSTSTTSAPPEMPPMPPITTEEVYIQDTGNEI